MTNTKEWTRSHHKTITVRHFTQKNTKAAVNNAYTQEQLYSSHYWNINSLVTLNRITERNEGWSWYDHTFGTRLKNVNTVLRKLKNDTIYLHMLKSWRRGQLSAQHQKRKNKEETKTKTEQLRRNGPGDSPWRQSGGRGVKTMGEDL